MVDFFYRNFLLVEKNNVGRSFFIEIVDDFFSTKNIFRSKNIFCRKKIIENFDEKNPIKKYFRSTTKIDQTIFDQKFSGFFFDEKFSTNNFSDHLFRSQMIQRFRKSHLEQRTAIIKIRTAPTKKKLLFYALFTVRPRPGRTRFVNLLSNSTGRHCTHQRRGRTEQNNSVGCFVASRPCSGGTLLVLAERP